MRIKSKDKEVIHRTTITDEELYLIEKALRASTTLPGLKELQAYIV